MANKGLIRDSPGGAAFLRMLSLRLVVTLVYLRWVKYWMEELGAASERSRDSEEHPTLADSCTLTEMTRCHNGNLDTHFIETAP